MFYTNKTITAAAVLILLLTTAIGCGSSRRSFDDLLVEGTELRVYEIFGMDCPGCHGGLENLIIDIPGVVASEANWEKQQIKIIISSKTDVTDEAIEKAVKQANFTLGKRIK